MKNIRVIKDVRVYKNVNFKKAIDLESPVSFSIPTKIPYYIKYLDLYFATHNKICKGNLNVTIDFSEEENSSFKVSLEKIKDNYPPLRFDLNKIVKVDKGITVKLDVTYFSKDKLAIWFNEIGPCGVIVAHEDITYALKTTPLISIITPVYKTDLKIFKQTVGSVLTQRYDNWEWLLVDDHSNDLNLSNYLKDLSKENKKIKVVTNKVNKGIAIASNVGIEKAKGVFIAFLDHDDMLTDVALLEIAHEINKNPKVDFIYSDEDKVNEEGDKFFSEFYKPDWNYPMFLSHMYTCHLGVYRTTIVKNKLHGFREGLDGSQDYDFVLRMIEETKNIRHIPKILYHWRICKGSTAEDISNKPQARINAVRAIEDHLSRIGKGDAIVQAGPFPGHYFVDYKIRKKPWPNVHIFVPFKDNVDCVLNLKHTIRITDYPNYNITFINNNSTEQSLKLLTKSLTKNEWKILDYNLPFNFSAINNYAVDKNKELYNEYCDYYLFLNDDIEIMHPEWLTQMVKQGEAREDVGAVGAKLLYANHKIQHAGIFLGVNGVCGISHKMVPDNSPGYYSRPHISQDITAVTGACMLVRSKAFHKIKGFDENLPRAFNDVDLCLRLWEKGWRVVYTPYARLYHHESVSRGRDKLQDPDFKKAIDYMEKRWKFSTYLDSHYNPNLPSNCEGNNWI
jgi:GT2 family glycosyltransferase